MNADQPDFTISIIPHTTTNYLVTVTGTATGTVTVTITPTTNQPYMSVPPTPPPTGTADPIPTQDLPYHPPE